MKGKTLLRLTSLLWVMLSITDVSEAIEPTHYKANWKSLDQYTCPEWYRDAKFGIFIHWGAYTVPAYHSEKYPRAMYSERWKDPATGELMRDYHKRTWGDQGEFGYKDFIPMFKGENFSADQWTDLFLEAGAKYVVEVAEHHDGFAMYNSKFTKWNCVNMGPKRDVTRELKDACYARDLKFGMSSHFANNWRYYAYEEGFDTMDPENYELYGKPHDRSVPPDKTFLKLWWNRTRDIIDQYQPDILWFDFFIDQPAFSSYHPKVAAYYFNRGLEWGKEVVLNGKNMNYESFPEDVIALDLERGKQNEIKKFPWQTDTSIGENSWSYIKGWKSRSANSLVDDLIDIVSKNGNLLLNVGPRADGTIPEDQTEVLRGIGKWLSVNGEAIYGTRPWLKYGEGVATTNSGPHTEHQNDSFTARDIRFTQKGDVLYAIVLDKPDQDFRIESLGKKEGLLARNPGAITLLGEDAKISWNQEDEGLSIHLEGTLSDSYAYVFKLQGIEMVNAEMKPLEEHVAGAWFYDRIRPAPIINGIESDIWGAPGVIPRDADNGIEDPEWAYWGGNPLLGEDGKYHLYIARWPESGGHMAWRESEVAHAVSDHILGPYTYLETICKGHNPEVIRLKQGGYALMLTQGKVYLADRLTGPWKFAGEITFDQRGLPGAPWRIHDNMTAVVRGNGSILMVSKDGHVFIAEDVLGPYRQVASRIYPKQFWYDGLEDPLIWKTENQYHLLVNKWIDKRAIYMRSRDGIHWDLVQGVAFDPRCIRYEDCTANTWWKVERPKVYMLDGQAAYLFLAVIDYPKNLDIGGDNHNSKWVGVPLTIGKETVFEPGKRPVSITKKIKIRMKDVCSGSHPEMDPETLRFGSPDIVNSGGGLKVKKWKCDGNDMVLMFRGDDHGISEKDYVAKILASNQKGEPIFAYARLPGQPAEYPVVLPGKVEISSLPDGKIKLTSSAFNFGLSGSSPTTVKLFRCDYVPDYPREELDEAWRKREKLEGDYGHQSGYRYLSLQERNAKLIGELEVPGLEPNASYDFEFILGGDEFPSRDTLDFRASILNYGTEPDVSGRSVFYPRTSN